MTDVVKAEFRIGKTQWAKWGNEAREAYNKVRRQGATHEIGVEEGNAVQRKIIDAANAPAPAPAVEAEETKKTETVKPVAPKKPRAPRTPKKKAK